MEGELINTQEGLEGELGYKGDRGYSAYEIAVKNGYEGTEQDWIDHFGLDLTDYLKTTDVVNSTDSDVTDKPLSAAKGKQLQQWVNMLYTDKADLTDLAYYEPKGTILWTNPDAGVSFSAQTIELNTDNYDVIEIISKRGSPVTLVKYKTEHGLTPNPYERSYGHIFHIQSSINITPSNYAARFVDWGSSGIQFGDAKSTTGDTVNVNCVPVAIIGRYLGLYNYDSNGGN